jgi:hypothetical protein
VCDQVRVRVSINHLNYYESQRAVFESGQILLQWPSS